MPASTDILLMAGRDPLLALKHTDGYHADLECGAQVRAVMYSHILVPTDGSELAQNGINHALSLAKALGSKVTIITVTRPFTPLGMEGGWVPPAEDLKRFDDEQDRAALDLLSKAKAAAEKMGLAASTEHACGYSAADAIVDAAKRLECSLIVMSSHGRRGISRILLGSQTSEVLAHSQVPVLVVR